MTRKLFTFALALLAAVGAWAQTTFTVDNLKYTVTDETANTVELTGYETQPTGTLDIPATVSYNGTEYSVTSIGERAFQSCYALMQITIPNSVTSIGDYAFYYCSTLTQVNIPNGVTTIGNAAFAYCDALTQVTIPSSVTSIGDYAFYYCSTLTQVNIGNSVTSIGDYAFAYCSALTQVTIPDSMENIGRWTFSNCSALTQVTWNAINCADYTRSDYRPFANCPVTNFTFGEQVEHIPAYLCYGMDKLMQVTIPGNVTNIGNSAFSGCSALTQVTWNAINCADYTSSDYRPFANCPVTNFTFGEQVEHIPAYLCYGMDKLMQVTLPGSITGIGDGTFSGCSALTQVTIPNSVTSIGKSAFSGCSALTEVTIPGNVTSIGNSAFSGCSALAQVTWNAINCADGTSSDNRPFADCPVTNFTFGEQAEHIPAYLCYGMDRLTEVTIPNSVTSIGNSAFSGCSALTQVTWNAINCADGTSSDNRPFADCPVTNFTFGEQVEHIPAYLCYGMDKLTQVTLPESVTSIGNSVFSNCSTLTQVTWNAINCADGTSSDNRPFADCPVTKVTFSSQVEHIPSYLCYGMSQFVSLSLPNSVTSIGAGVFGQSGIMSFVMPASITELGVDAFKECNKLNAIVFGGNAAEWCGIDFKNEAANPIYNASENVKLYINNQPVGKLVIPEGVTEIRNYAFNKASFLTFIDIPESVTAIGESAFAGCTALDSIYCRAAVPPTITATTFSETDYSIPLHVPAESFVQYLTTDYWNAFTNLQADLTQQLSYTVNYYVAGSNAYFSNRIAQGETFRCYVTAAEGKNIVSITLNGMDITSQLGADGLLQIENITEDCTLIISTDAGQTTETTGTQQDAAVFRAWQSNGEVFVEHTQDMTGVALYDVNGRLLHQTGTNGYGVLRMTAPGKIHIVRATYADGTTASQKVM